MCKTSTQDTEANEEGKCGARIIDTHSYTPLQARTHSGHTTAIKIIVELVTSYHLNGITKRNK